MCCSHVDVVAPSRWCCLGLTGRDSALKGGRRLAQGWWAGGLGALPRAGRDSGSWEAGSSLGVPQSCW